jgi:hypothetical protein
VVTESEEHTSLRPQKFMYYILLDSKLNLSPKSGFIEMLALASLALAMSQLRKDTAKTYYNLAFVDLDYI